MIHKSVEEFYVKLLEFSGLGPALKALRLPFGGSTESVVSPSMSEHSVIINQDAWNILIYGNHVKMSPKDSGLITTLVKRGDEHAKVLRGVCVWCEIHAPRYFYQELDRYRIGCECLSSESTMHIQGKGLSEDELVVMKDNLTEGTMQTRIWMFSYQTLRRIYFQRCNHRLPHWRKFCEWIEGLPLAKELIFGDDGDYHRDK